MGMHLESGRDISWEDGPKNEKVVIINQTIARRLWPGEDPIGRISRLNGTDTKVIGVVADVHESSVEGNRRLADVPAGDPMGTSGSPTGGAHKVAAGSPCCQRHEHAAPDQPWATGDASSGPSSNWWITWFRRADSLFLLVGIFAALGLILASLGIYGVISYSVTQRTQEIGIRMALGATQAQVQIGVMGKTLRLALAGGIVGIVASFVVARLISSLLFATAPTDPITFAGMILLLAAVAFIAGYVPARRASQIDPMTALRNN